MYWGWGFVELYKRCCVRQSQPSTWLTFHEEMALVGGRGDQYSIVCDLTYWLPQGFLCWFRSRSSKYQSDWRNRRKGRLYWNDIRDNSSPFSQQRHFKLAFGGGIRYDLTSIWLFSLHHLNFYSGSDCKMQRAFKKQDIHDHDSDISRLYYWESLPFNKYRVTIDFI